MPSAAVPSCADLLQLQSKLEQSVPAQFNVQEEVVKIMRRMSKHFAGVAAAFAGALCSGPIAAWAQDQAPQTNPTANQAAEPEAAPTLQLPLAVTLSANDKPAHFNAGELGPIYLTSVLSGFGQWQTNVAPGDRHWQFDFDNVQLFLNKPDGMLQFFVQAGFYAIPVIGVPYVRAVDASTSLYTLMPQAYVKLAPTPNFSLMAGKLPTLIGAESTFTFQNMNIQRGLLWNQENAVNRGVQATYLSGPLTLSAAWHDGFYSNRYSWLTLSAAYAIDKTNTLTAIAAGNTNHTNEASARTPLAQNNQQIYNLIYTYANGPWTIQPYLQYSHVPRLAQFGIEESASTYGAALLLNYDLGSPGAPAALRTEGLKLAGRLEYISTTGSVASGAPNLLYGPGSSAWSFTLTPTYQRKNFFVRGELSYVGASEITAGAAFGPDGNKHAQVRGVFELGLLF
ncbi:MAG: outer membrane beta-barrel protein [Telluria sp.]